MKPLIILSSTVLVALVACRAHAMNIGGMKYCQDLHGSTYTVEVDRSCGDDPLEYGHTTPEYQYTDRATQRLQMILNQYSAQAQERIADGYGGANSIGSITTNANTTSSGANSGSNSRASNSNTNTSNNNLVNNNRNTNSNTNVNAVGVWN